MNLIHSANIPSEYHFYDIINLVILVLKGLLVAIFKYKIWLFIIGVFVFFNINNLSTKKKIFFNFLIVNLIFYFFTIFVIYFSVINDPRGLSWWIDNSVDRIIYSISGFFIISIIYVFAGFMTIIGGLLADRYSLKIIYVIGIIAQAPCYFFIATFTGISLVIVCLLAMMFNSSILPTENILLAKFTPEKHHGLIYGIKFIVVFGVAPLAVYLVAKTYELTSEFNNLFFLISFIMVFIGFLALFLPIKPVVFRD